MKNFQRIAAVTVAAVALAAGLVFGGRAEEKPRLSAVAEKSVRDRLADVAGLEDPLATRRAADDYAATLGRATYFGTRELSEIGASERRGENDDAAERQLWDLSAAAGRLAVSVKAFADEGRDEVPLDSERGRMIEHGGAPPMTFTVTSPDGFTATSRTPYVSPSQELDGEGRCVFRRESVLREQWAEVQRVRRNLEILLGGQAGAR